VINKQRNYCARSTIPILKIPFRIFRSERYDNQTIPEKGSYLS
jgi:hypothetical protein